MTVHIRSCNRCATVLFLDGISSATMHHGRVRTRCSHKCWTPDSISIVPNPVRVNKQMGIGSPPGIPSNCHARTLKCTIKRLRGKGCSSLTNHTVREAVITQSIDGISIDMVVMWPDDPSMLSLIHWSTAHDPEWMMCRYLAMEHL